jgi:hypothetical protein
MEESARRVRPESDAAARRASFRLAAGTEAKVVVARGRGGEADAR